MVVILTSKWYVGRAKLIAQRTTKFFLTTQGMLNHLKEKKDVGFFTSIAGLMNSCSVLDLDAFERNTKAEGMRLFRKFNSYM